MIIHLTTREDRDVAFNLDNIEAVYPHQSLPNVTCIQTVSGEEWHIKGNLNSVLERFR